VTTRADALETLEAGHRALAELFDRLDDEAFVRPHTIGTGREWSAKDLAAHMGVWEALALETLEHVRRGEQPGVEDLFGEGAEDGFNDEQVGRLRGMTSAEVRARFEELHARVSSALGAMRDQEWAAPYAFDPIDEDRTLGERLGSLLGAEDGRFRHAFAHLDDLRAYVETT
jgi:hypothetical protein